jgi:CRP/FNR family transcriptional regulator, cyclic AMP receptor protein
MQSTSRPRGETIVRVLDEDLELAAAVEQASFTEARLAAVAPLIEVPKGAWEPPSAARERGRDFGLLVLSGLLVRDMELASRCFVELRGPEDLLRPWDDVGDVTSVSAAISWTAREPTRLAWLDGDFARSVCEWPEITATLLARATRRARQLSFRLAIFELTHVKLRVLLLLWHLADRWGRVGAEGVRLDLDLTHELIARMIGAHRTSVTVALRELHDDGRLTRDGRRTVLLGEPPDKLNDAHGTLAASGARAPWR